MKRFNLLHLFLLLPFMAIMVSCSDDGNDDSPSKPVVKNTCEGCHTDYETLKSVYSPDTDLPAGGCGGEAPHIEPYDRVYMGGDGFQDFKKSEHYKLGCVACHNGTDNTSDKALAHSGTFISKPAWSADQKCASCHADEVSKGMKNIHNGWGQMRKVAMRAGFAGYQDFNKLSEKHKEGYSKNCQTCHASCGECHVNRPSAGGGGLMNGHKFTKEPDMVKTCVVCHSSRGGHAFLGVAAGSQPDVHRTKLGYTCMNCHSKNELHGDGAVYDQRYKVANKPQCTNCHPNVASSNQYHSTHSNTFNCQVCHSQSYNSCGSCHVGGEGARITSYQDFKIAANPIKGIKNYELSLVRRTPHAPDSWSLWSVPLLANFDVLPTYNYTTPHNILRWTDRTKTTQGDQCYASCHIVDDNGTKKNKNLYLLEENLLPWELNATKGITVDNKLPAGWLK